MKPVLALDTNPVLMSFSCQCAWLLHWVLLTGCTASGIELGLEAGPGSGGGKRLDNGGLLDSSAARSSKGLLVIVSARQAAC